MLKNNGKKTAVCVSTAAVLCLLMLLVAVRHRGAQVRAKSTGQEDTRSPPGAEAGEASAQSGGQKGFSAYFGKLSRGRREAEKPTARSSGSAGDTAPPPAEDIRPDDLFIAVKTTKKFHQSRLNLLLDTWISRSMQQVTLMNFTDAYNKAPCLVK